MINPNVAKLQLPRNMKRLHSSFNVDLLYTHKPNASEFTGRPIPKASPIILESDTGEELHIVERLLRCISVAAKSMASKWHGLPECDIT